jgi:hypothetical protein
MYPFSQDIHALTAELEFYERKYGVLSETFFETYMSGEEPEDDAWVPDFAVWAGTYRQQSYFRPFAALKALRTLAGAFSSKSTIRWLRAREQPT